MTADDDARLRMLIADPGDEIGNVVLELSDMANIATRCARSLVAADVENIDIGGIIVCQMPHQQRQISAVVTGSCSRISLTALSDG